MNNQAGWVLGALTVLAIACQGPPSSVPDPEPDPASTLRFAPSMAAAEAGTFSTEFTLLGARNIYAVADVTLPAGVHLAKLEVRNPHGVLHASAMVAVTTDESAPAELIDETTHMSVPVTHVTVTNGLARIVVPIPVAGTDFTQFRLTGTFGVALALAGSNGTPLASSSFVMSK